ncbi:LysM peptidoglycan-binding domain-containing protein [Lactobacillus delbrueckii]|nr:LysM peptidoglycan-binding domain-containing protein [Lactobacillus delbrueckii]
MDNKETKLGSTNKPEPVEPKATDKAQAVAKPEPAYFSPAKEKPDDSVYVAKEGDTLFSIAMDKRVSLGRLKHLNGFRSAKAELNAGKAIKLPKD